MERTEMLKLRLDGRTYQYIADSAGVSRQRIHQVLSPPLIVRDFVVKKYNGRCDVCDIFVGKGGHVHHNESKNEENYNDLENLQLLCLSCHRKSHRKPPSLGCCYCGKKIRKGIFCGEDCFKKYHRVTLTCSYCGKEFTLKTSVAYWRTVRNQSGKLYCSRRCQGKWLSDNYGFRFTKTRKKQA